MGLLDRIINVTSPTPEEGTFPLPPDNSKVPDNDDRKAANQRPPEPKGSTGMLDPKQEPKPRPKRRKR